MSITWPDESTDPATITTVSLDGVEIKMAPLPDHDAIDAARYRWLRENNIAHRIGVFADDDCNTWLYEEKLDMAVDAEMATHARRDER